MVRKSNSYFQPKILFALSSAGVGSALMYMPIYYTSVLGLRTDQIGIFAAISPFISAIASPLWSTLVDKTQAYRKLISINYTVAALCALLIILAPAIPRLVSTSDIDYSDIPEYTNATDPTLESVDGAESSSSFTLVLVAFATIGFAAFGAPVLGPLLDGGVLRILGDNRELYGQQRLWASVGFGSAIFVTGLLLEWTGDMNVIFYVFGTTAVGFIFAVSQTDFDVSARVHRFDSEVETSTEEDEEDEQDERVYVDEEEERLRNRTVFGMVWENVEPLVTQGMTAVFGSSFKSLSLSATATDMRRSLNMDTHRGSSTTHTLDPKNDVTVTLLSADDLVQVVHHQPSRASATVSSVSAESAVTLLSPNTYDENEKASSSSSSHLNQIILSQNGNTTLQELISDPAVIAFLATMMLMGISFSVFHNFLMLFLREDLGASDAMLGWIGPLVLVVEIPCFFYSKEIIAQIGIESMIIISQVTTIVRVLIYTVCPSLPGGAGLALFVQLSHGLAYSALWSAAVVHADAIAPKQLRATSQGLMNAAFSGVGSGLGAFLGGAVYQRAGARAMFLMVAVVTTLALILFVETSTEYGMLCWVVKRARSQPGQRPRRTVSEGYEEIAVQEL